MISVICPVITCLKAKYFKWSFNYLCNILFKLSKKKKKKRQTTEKKQLLLHQQIYLITRSLQRNSRGFNHVPEVMKYLDLADETAFNLNLRSTDNASGCNSKSKRLFHEVMMKTTHFTLPLISPHKLHRVNKSSNKCTRIRFHWHEMQFSQCWIIYSASWRWHYVHWSCFFFHLEVTKRRASATSHFLLLTVRLQRENWPHACFPTTEHSPTCFKVK